MATKTEYKVIKTTDDKLAEVLNSWAPDGWRLVSLVSPFQWTLIAVLEKQS